MKALINKIVHKAYFIFGKIVCALLLMIYTIRDIIKPVKSDSILFVAHPDDDALFFNNYISENKPYVVLLFTGWSCRRINDFLKAMRHYGVRCRAYSTVSKDAYNDIKRRNKTERTIKKCLKIGSFKTVVTHNCSGEYGHPTHKLVHECVVKNCNNGLYDIICPVDVSEICKYPLDDEKLRTKRYMFEEIYKSEAFVMTEEEAGTPIWFYNEKLEKIN